MLFTRKSPDAQPDRQVLIPGESTIIESNVLHKAEPVRKIAEVIVFSHPGWTQENHKFLDDFPKN